MIGIRTIKTSVVLNGKNQREYGIDQITDNAVFLFAQLFS